MNTPTIAEIEDKIGFLLATISNLQDTLKTLTDDQRKEAFDCIKEADDTIDNFIFSLED